MGFELPDEPPNDPITAYLLSAFRSITRGRRFLATMAGAFPLPLSAREISDWLDSHPSPMTRDEVDAVMFALDGVCLAGDDE
ncbi:hypothetical protein C1Y30_23195 [Pseudomonas sp. GW704-F3]|nr:MULTISPECIES: hypothetical protein [unclassified Pseudomonas]PMU87066.1 hypothetical protein C1Y30_23195 [Pseudomonas sp. GW704-F3]PMU91396.1 hypothetical protein C1Y28_23005 [Pseudomonas sp. GW704-F5]PMV01196.1 hypothetical protein C1Y29_19965 [Pseudomonas sp. MPBD4-3]PMV25740.1 hypothetical protein C1Y27_23590 [Pseudomonas sp. GW704-F2]